MNDSIPSLEAFIEPSQVPFTFEAPGWFAVGAMLLLLVAGSISWAIYHHIRNRYRRLALKRLHTIEENMSATGKYAGALLDANMLLKDICISLYSGDRCAALRGEEWIRMLNTTVEKELFDTVDAQTIASVYNTDKGPGRDEATRFIRKAARWIEKHKHKINFTANPTTATDASGTGK